MAVETRLSPGHFIRGDLARTDRMLFIIMSEKYI